MASQRQSGITEAIISGSVEFPIDGEWVAIQTPGHCIPSHGTDYFGQRYAYDFVMLNGEGQPYAGSLWSHLLGRIRSEDCYGWAKRITACADGMVVKVGDGWPDPRRLSILRDFVFRRFHSRAPTATDYRPLAGNHVIIACEGFHVLYAHLRAGSIRVAEGAHVKAGDWIGNVGNSGNSTLPHLHFQAMDGPDPLQARGVFCNFISYERWSGDHWQLIERGVPGKLERIRRASPHTSAHVRTHASARVDRPKRK